MRLAHRVMRLKQVGGNLHSSRSGVTTLLLSIPRNATLPWLKRDRRYFTPPNLVKIASGVLGVPGSRGRRCRAGRQVAAYKVGNK